MTAKIKMPGPVYIAHILAVTLGAFGAFAFLVQTEDASSYRQGHLFASWAPTWIAAAFALRFPSGARNRMRWWTVALLGFCAAGSISALEEAVTPGEYVVVALRIALAAPVIVLLLLPESGTWFNRPSPAAGMQVTGE